MTVTLNIDLETFSSVDITKAGMYRYVQSPDFEILLFAYSFAGMPVKIVDLAQRETIPQNILSAIVDPTVTKKAYNAAFEWYCLSKFFGNVLPLNQWRCTMVHGLYCGYPAGLAAIGEAIGLPRDKRKMGIGRSLIKLFCTPTKPTAKNGNRSRTYPHHDPGKWDLFKSYCVQDVVTEMAVDAKLDAFPVPEQEQWLWEIDQQINAYGATIDTDLVTGALHLSEISTQELTNAAIQLTGLENPKSVKQLTKWLEEETGEEIENLQKETVKGLISTLDDSAAKQMLEIRQELSKTSVKKYTAMQTAVCQDNRVRGLLQFYGANRTGRWAGRLVQIQNLPKNHMEALDVARECVKKRHKEAVMLLFGSIPDTLSQLIRTAFIPAPGHTLLVSDFSAIEARIVSWLAGEQWRLDVFAGHGKIYEASASQMFGVPIESIVKGNPEYELRAKGKVAELACGYGGGVGALKRMGADKMGLSDEELLGIIRRWRAANKRIVDFWYTVENAVLEVMRTGAPVGVKNLIFAREMDARTDQDFLTITLPSGRKLYYVKPFLLKNDRGREALHFWGVDQDTKKWGVVSTYGGKLVENITQAIARDCLAESIVRLTHAGYPILFHVHDEVIVEVLKETAHKDLEEVFAAMGQPISWAPGLLLKADGFTTDFYKKE
jgi:DNA polymerase